MLLDIYILAKHRAAKEVSEFLDHFVPTREEAASEYEVPHMSDTPRQLFESVNAILNMCERNYKQEYGLYWNAPVGENPHSGMAFFTEDGGLILGLSVHESDSQSGEYWLGRMKEWADTEVGYITCETPPPLNAVEFRKVCRTST